VNKFLRKKTEKKESSVLGTSLRGTYVMYPYHEFHKDRALGSPECYQIRYLITTRIRIQFLRTKVHVE
jgi:hypothetical protein